MSAIQSKVKELAATVVAAILGLPAYAGMAIQLDLHAPEWVYSKRTGLIELVLVIAALAVAAFWPSPKKGDDDI